MPVHSRRGLRWLISVACFEDSLSGESAQIGISMRALWSDRRSCSHKVSSSLKHIWFFSEGRPIQHPRHQTYGLFQWASRDQDRGTCQASLKGPFSAEGWQGFQGAYMRSGLTGPFSDQPSCVGGKHPLPDEKQPLQLRAADLACQHHIM